MSRLLKLVLLSAVVVIIAAILFLRLRILFFVFLLTIVLIVSDRLAARKIIAMRSLFSANRFPRIVNTLVIGDICDKKEFDVAHTVFVTAPGRSLVASSQLLAHLSSVINEEGTVHIYYRGSHSGITLFDAPFIHPITRKELGCESLDSKSNHPMFYKPIQSIRFLLDSVECKMVHYHEAQCPDQGIVELCQRHSFKLIYHVNNVNS